jgi:ABC-type transport system involved in cytochrome bd biosynthesis fused ATPase/permease subunit
LENPAKNVSGGEKKKIAVARALFNTAEIFIFDEATAGYDKSSYVIFLHNKFGYSYGICVYEIE